MQGKRPLVQDSREAFARSRSLRFGVVNNKLIVDLDNDIPALHFDVIVKPNIVISRWVPVVDNLVDAPRFDHVPRVRVVELFFQCRWRLSL